MWALLTGLIGGLPGMVNTIFAWLGKKTDAALEKFRIQNNNEAQVSTVAIQGDVQKSIAMMDLQKSAMNHPIWWLAWALYILPAGVHSAAVHFVSTFHLALIVDKLPPDFIAQDKMIVMSLFGAQIGTGVIDKVVNAWVAKK
jgi:hypothetical protein